MQWDIFCAVIDNHGDLGVCWRLAADLAGRGERARLWVDDARARAWMAPQGASGVQVLPWTGPFDAAAAAPGEVLVEAFGCNPPAAFIAQAAAAPRPPVWINLEYLSAEAYVERSHGLPSGAVGGMRKWFFYPGFTPRTGGLIREPWLAPAIAAHDAPAWRSAHGLRQTHAPISLFCYEPPALPAWLRRLADRGGPGTGGPVELAVAAGRAREAVERAEHAGFDGNFGKKSNKHHHGQLSILNMPLLPQTDYDRLLWSSAVNFVRGEDSLVRALWAGQPFIWQAYPQDDGAHAAKLHAFLHWLAAPPWLADWHAIWNALAPTPRPGGAWPQWDMAQWTQTVRQARDRLWAQDDLGTQLLRFVQAKSTSAVRANP